MASHRRPTRRLRLRGRPVPRPAIGCRRQSDLFAQGAAVSTAGVDHRRSADVTDFDLAVLVDAVLSVEWTVRRDCRGEAGERANAALPVAIVLVLAGLFAFFAVLLRLT